MTIYLRERFIVMSIECLCRCLFGLVAGCIGVFYPFCSFLERCSLKFTSLHEVEASRCWNDRNASNHRDIWFRGRRGGLLFLLLFNSFFLNRSSWARGIKL